jgi:hypothetical protein
MTTVDSTIGIDVEYIYPQHPDSCEFILAEYLIHNRAAVDLLGLNIGSAIDFDVVPGPLSLRNVQNGVQNTGHWQPDWNLAYQQGADTIGHIVVGDSTATRFKGGITAIQCDSIPRGWIAPNDPWLDARTGGGFHAGYLYSEMTRTGFQIFPPNDPDPEEDLHTVMILGQDVNLSPVDTVRYTVGLVSSNQGNNDPTDLINTTKKAWRYAFGWRDVVTSDIVPEFTAMSYPYAAVGTHEDGHSGGCCGCIVDKVGGADELTIVPGPDPCRGTIEFAGGQPCCAPYSAIFRLRDLCGTYEDIIMVDIWFDAVCSCTCPFQCDFDEDTFLTALDLGELVDVLFSGAPDIQDPACPNRRGDFDCDGFTTALDLSGLVDHLFDGGPAPCDPCSFHCISD